MKQFLLLSLLFLSAPVNSQTPELDWVSGIEGTNSQLEMYSLATTQEGYVYGLFGFKGDVWSYNCWGFSSAGNLDVGIVKMNRYGKCLWMKRVGGKGIDQGVRIKLLTNGSILIVGGFKDTVDFNPDAIAQDVRVSNGSNDCFALLLDGDGNYLNCKTFGGTRDDVLFGIDEDANQTIWVSGRFQDSIDLDSQGGSTIHLAPNGNGSFIMQMDTQLNVINSLSISAKDYATIYDLDVSRNGYVHYAAYFDDTLTCSYNDTTVQIVSNGSVDCLYSIIDLDGNFVEQLHIGSPYFEMAFGLTELSDGKYVMQVMYEDSLPLIIHDELQFIHGNNFSSTSSDYVRNSAVVKLDGTNLEWCKTINSINNSGYIFFAADPVVDEIDNVYFAAQYTTVCTLNQNGLDLIGEHDGSGALIVKLTPNGLVENLYTINGSGTIRPFCIYLDDRTLYVAGMTGGSQNDFDLSETSYPFYGGYAVVAKYNLSDPFLITDILQSEMDRIYPNPTDNQLILSNPEMREIHIFDLSGREMVLEERLNGLEIELNTSNISNGNYLLTYQLDGEMHSQRFVVLH